MPEIIRTRVIRPSTRLKTSVSYKINTEVVGSGDTLRVEITHESKPGRWVYFFNGRDVCDRRSISFSVIETGRKVDISSSGAQPVRNSLAAQSAPPATAGHRLVPLATNTKPALPKNENHRKHSLPPLHSADAQVLILGSLPGDESLRLQQYYANLRNQFWQLMATVLNEPLPATYEQKTNMLLKHKVALWDVAHSALRPGSLDSEIADEEPNDLTAFIKAHPRLKLICFNGSKARIMFDRFFSKMNGITFLDLPSSSSARTIPFEKKIYDWSEIRRILNV